MDKVDTSIGDTINVFEELNKSKERGEKKAYALKVTMHF